MSLNDVKFNRNKSGLGAPLLNKDHVSGILFYNNVLPSGFSVSEREKTFFSIEDVEDAGIVEGSADHAKEWYHLAQFFQKNPKGEIKVGFYAVPATPATHDFAEVATIQTFANGEIRQLGIYYPVADYADALINAIQTQVTALQVLHQPLNVLFTADFSNVADLSTLTDLRALFDNNISVTIGQDGAGKGAALFVSEGVTISDLGAKLGAISAAPVNESIAYVERFPMVTDGTEFETVAFANGDLYKDLSSGLIDAIDDKGYLFLVKHIGYSGTYNNDSYTAVATTNDLATIENNRTIDKAVRVTRSYLVPKIASPITVNADGTLSEDTIAIFKSEASKGLAQMEADAELSAYQVIINPAQDVLATSKVTITLELVPRGVARSIVVNVGFVKELS